MKTPTNTSNNNNTAASAERVADQHDNVENNRADGAGASFGEVSHGESQADAMDLDDPSVADDLCSRHSDDVSKASDEKISLQESKRSEYERKLHQCTADIDVLMGLPFSVDKVEREERKAQIEYLQFQLNHFKASIVTCNELIVSYKDEKFKLLTQEKQFNAVDERVLSKEASYLRIQEKDLPAFDVTPMYERQLAKSDYVDGTEAYMDLRNGEKSLNAFITKYERVYQYKNV